MTASAVLTAHSFSAIHHPPYGTLVLAVIQNSLYVPINTAAMPLPVSQHSAL
jgi:hypothetical protein